MSKPTVFILGTVLLSGATADVRAPDWVWITLDNEYYSAYLEYYDDFIVLYDVETTGIAKQYLAVGVLADDAPDFGKVAESLREEQPEGTSVIFPTP